MKLKKIDNCNICKSSERVLIIDRDFPKHWICKKCGFVYMDPIVDSSENINYYETDYWEKRNKSWGDVRIIKDGLLNENERSKDIYNWINPYVNENSLILEIGSGFGHNLAYLNNKLKCRVIGIEPSKEGVRFSRDTFGIDVYKGSFESFDYDQKFDAIIMSHVLEHFENPFFVLKKCKDILTSQGVLYIEVPNVLSPNRRKNQAGWFSIEHISYFSLNKVLYLLSETGFLSKREEVRNYVRVLANNCSHKVEKEIENEYYKVRFNLLIHSLAYNINYAFNFFKAVLRKLAN